MPVRLPRVFTAVHHRLDLCAVVAFPPFEWFAQRGIVRGHLGHGLRVLRHSSSHARACSWRSSLDPVAEHALQRSAPGVTSHAFRHLRPQPPAPTHGSRRPPQSLSLGSFGQLAASTPYAQRLRRLCTSV